MYESYVEHIIGFPELINRYGTLQAHKAYSQTSFCSPLQAKLHHICLLAECRSTFACKASSHTPTHCVSLLQARLHHRHLLTQHTDRQVPALGTSAGIDSHCAFRKWVATQLLSRPDHQELIITEELQPNFWAELIITEEMQPKFWAKLIIV